MGTILQVNNLTKKYHQHLALDNVSLELKKGEIYGLIGRNGAGKTTLLKAITRLIDSTDGEISLFGSQISSEWTKGLERTGTVIETPVAYDQLTAKQNLAYYCKLRGIVDADKIIKETLALVDLADTGKKKFKNFSLGMKQKLGIAIAVLSNPDFLILDEPINGLDPIAIVDFRRLIKRLNEEKGMTILISSHILTELYQVATKFGIINDGRLIKEITKTEFEELNQSYITLKTPDIERASMFIQDSLGFPIKAVAKKSVHIFGEATQIRDMIEALVHEKIIIDEIFYSKQELETYFTNLIGHQGGEENA